MEISSYKASPTIGDRICNSNILTSLYAMEARFAKEFGTALGLISTVDELALCSFGQSFFTGTRTIENSIAEGHRVLHIGHSVLQFAA